jgi:hypothetical protein
LVSGGSRLMDLAESSKVAHSNQGGCVESLLRLLQQAK